MFCCLYARWIDRGYKLLCGKPKTVVRIRTWSQSNWFYRMKLHWQHLVSLYSISVSVVWVQTLIFGIVSNSSTSSPPPPEADCGAHNLCGVYHSLLKLSDQSKCNPFSCPDTKYLNSTIHYVVWVVGMGPTCLMHHEVMM